MQSKRVSSVRSIRRVLIANRGEIARRIIRSLNALGIESIAVFTDPDRRAPHVAEATHSVSLGAPTAYLSVESIVQAAQSSGADAVHPGYGFLSENPALPEALTQVGIHFIGPAAQTIRTLGSKTAAKEIAARASVEVSPTLLLTRSDNASATEAIAHFAAQTGFPLIVKAAAGGGGRGMRIITATSDIAAEIESARRESLQAFGSEEIFVERFIAPARHIEVQIAGDLAGNVVALGTRDCSLQRSNQKIIEEAPAPNLTPETESALLAAASRLAATAGYSNLGTVEFLYAPDGKFYFLEVNTRLQVEHPVTEAVTGLDLVALQVRLAEGQTLAQCGINGTPSVRGHALEARLCAEEFNDGFVLSTGSVIELQLPTTTLPDSSIRTDMGVEVGSVVTHYYDSLIGKIISHAGSRDEAIAALIQALSHTRVAGVKTNRALLMHLLATEPFQKATHSVQGTKDLLPTKHDTLQAIHTAHTVAAALRLAETHSTWAASSPWHQVSLSRPLAYLWTTRSSGVTLSSQTTLNGNSAEVTLRIEGSHEQHTVSLLSVAQTSPSAMHANIAIDGSQSYEVSITREAQSYWVHLPHGTWMLVEESKPSIGSATGSGSSGSSLTAHIPGRVAAIHVAVGDHVEEGALLLVLDSMKMEHPLKAPISGRISAVLVACDEIVQGGAVLLSIEAKQDGSGH